MKDELEIVTAAFDCRTCVLSAIKSIKKQARWQL